MKWLKYGIIIAAIILFVLSQLRCVGENERIIVTGPGKTKVISEAEGSHYPSVHIIAELEIGDTLEVLSYEYLKDCKIYKVLTKDGRRGWITLGDNCEWVDINEQRHGSTGSP